MSVCAVGNLEDGFVVATEKWTAVHFKKPISEPVVVLSKPRRTPNLLHRFGDEEREAQDRGLSTWVRWVHRLRCGEAPRKSCCSFCPDCDRRLKACCWYWRSSATRSCHVQVPASQQWQRESLSRVWSTRAVCSLERINSRAGSVRGQTLARLLSNRLLACNHRVSLGVLPVRCRVSFTFLASCFAVLFVPWDVKPGVPESTNAVGVAQIRNVKSTGFEVRFRTDLCRFGKRTVGRWPERSWAMVSGRRQPRCCTFHQFGLLAYVSSSRVARANALFRAVKGAARFQLHCIPTVPNGGVFAALPCRGCSGAVTFCQLILKRQASPSTGLSKESKRNLWGRFQLGCSHENIRERPPA